MPIITKKYHAPCGVLILGSSDHKLCICDWLTEKHSRHADRLRHRLSDCGYEEGSSEVIEDAITQLDEYFEGKRRTFSLPLLFTGTDFQNKVREALLAIPYGETVTYGELARQIGHPKAVRAVANAIASNDISIFTPCHRVIGSDHTLTGYAGGLAAKEYLLKLEMKLCQIETSDFNAG